jgi:fibronectin-binding autotransporter adhesin
MKHDVVAAFRLAGVQRAVLLPARAAALILVGTLPVPSALADNFLVANDAELRAAIQLANAAPGPHFIEFQSDIVLSGALPPVLNTMTFKGRDYRLDGSGQFQLLSIGSADAASGPRILVNVNDLTLANGLATGGNGADGGGGGMGAGGALFVNARADVVLQNVSVVGSRAVGGNGAAGAGGGGGGLGGAGGAGPGGGGGGLQGTGGSGGTGGGGGGALAAGGAGGANAGGGGGGLAAGGSAGTDGGDGAWRPLWAFDMNAGDALGGGRGGGDGGGGGGAADGSGTGGGGGGFGGADASTDSGADAGILGGGGGAAGTGHGGNGGYAGGGGGAIAGDGGNGGGGGGGGGSASAEGGDGGYGGGGGSGAVRGGDGGFGGGGGAGTLSGGAAGSGGGAGGLAGGGGGGGFGGAVFVAEGGGLSIGGRTFVDGNAAEAGAGAADGVAGLAAGGGLFLEGSGNLMVRGPTAGATQILADDIADAYGAGLAGTLPFERWNLIVAGGSREGRIELSGNNSYSGDTYILGSTLIVTEQSNLGGTNGIVVFDDGGLGMNDGFVLTRDTVVNSGGASFTVLEEGLATVAGNLRGEGEIIKNGTGDLEFLANTTFAGSWRVSQGSLVLDSNARLGSSALTLDGGALRFSADINDFRGFRIDAGAVLDNAGHDITVVGDISGWVAGQTTTFRGGGEFLLLGEAAGDGVTVIESGRVTGDVANGTVQIDAGAGWSLGGSDRQVALLAGAGSVDLGANRLGVRMVQPADEDVPPGGTFDGQITGSGSLQLSNADATPGFTPLATTAANARVLTLTADNAYSGGTLISKGAGVAIQRDSVLGSGGITLSGGVLVHGGETSALAITLADGGGGIHTLAPELHFTGTLGGAGTLVKSGAGTLYLDRDNDWAGDTWVIGRNSLLALGSPGALGSGGLTLAAGGGLRLLADTPALMPLTVAEGAGVIDTGEFTAHSDGSISGSQPEDQLEKVGTGTLVITGDSAFTGPVALQQGELHYGDGGSAGLLPGAIEIQSSGTLVFNRADDITFAGDITGQGQVVKRGSGRLQLVGNNRFGGGMRVESGYVAGGDAQFGDGLLFLDGGGLDMNSSMSRNLRVGAGDGEVRVDDAALSFYMTGQVDGAGELRKTGAGTLEVGGQFNPQGGIDVREGTLVVGRGINGAVYSNIDVDAGASVLFGREDIVSFNPVLSGEGRVVKNGLGDLILTGENTHTGLLRVERGKLQVGAGGTNAKAGSIASAVQLDAGATLQFSRSDDVDFGGNVTGSGALVQDGFGLLRLTGDNSAFAGSLLVTRGSVEVNGVVGGNVDVFSGVLQGIGRAEGNVHVFPGARLALGDTVSTFTINGDLTLDAGARWEIDVRDTGAVDHATVAGTVQLGGELVVTGSNRGNYPDTGSWRFLDAGLVTGTFSSVTDNLAFFNTRVEYGADFVDLQLIRNGIGFSDVALSQNQRAVAGAIELMGNAHPVKRYVNGLDVPGARAAFNALSGDSLLANVVAPARFGGAFAQTLQRRNNRLGGASGGPDDAIAQFDTRYATLRAGGQVDLLGTLATQDAAAAVAGVVPLPAASSSRIDGVWLESRQVTQNENANNAIGNAAAEFTGTMTTLGIDGYWGDDVILGVAISQAAGSASFDNRDASVDVDGVILGTYGRWNLGDSLHAKFAFSLGQFDNAATRAVPVGGTVMASATAVGVLGASAEAGWTLRAGKWGLRPYSQIAIERALSGQYTETGGQAALYVDEASIDVMRFGAGVDASRPWLIGRGQWAQLLVAAGIEQPLGGGQAAQKGAFADSGVAYTVNGASHDSMTFALGISGEWYFGRNIAVGAGYQLRAGGDDSEQGVIASLNLKW